MSEHTTTSQTGGQPSEEELRAYLNELRTTPVDQVVAELLSGLLNAAQVKLGRRDARLLIDVAAAVVDRARDRLPDALTSQVDQALTQLRLGQVEAEKEVAAAAGQGHTEDADLDPTPADSGTSPPPSGAGPETSPPAGSSGPAGPGGPSGPRPGSSPTDRLWIPGR